MKRSLRRGALAALAGVMFLCGCTTGGASVLQSGDETVDGTLLRTSVDQPASFDPTQGTSLPDFVLARNGFDTLVRRDDDNSIVGGLADSWSETDDGIRFVLRDDVTCSDGTPITADVVKKSYEYFTSPETASVYGPQVFGPRGNASFDAVDDHTLDIHLKRSWPDMLTGLSMAASGIICPAGLEDPEKLAAGHVEGAESGPYVLARSEHGVRYTYRLREDYASWPDYAEQLPGDHPEVLQYNVITDKNATANQLVSGQLDVGFVYGQSVDRLKGTGTIDISKEPFSDFYILFNERSGSPFTDPDKRRAVAQLMNRDTFENITSYGEGTSATQMAAPGIACTDPESSPVIAEDEQTATKVLDGTKVRIVSSQIIGPQGVGNTYVQERLLAAGADVTLQNLDVGGWVSTVYGQPSDWDLTIWADLNFPGSMATAVGQFIGPTIQEGGGNVGATQSPEAERAYEEYLDAHGEDAQCSAIADASDALIEQAHAIPLSNDPRLMANRQGFVVVSKGGALDDQHLMIIR